MGTNGSPSCAPGLKSTDTTILSSSLLSAYFCYPKFTAILNNNNLNGYTYGWYFTYWSSDGGSLGTICEVPNTITAYAPALSVPGGRTVLVGVNFFIEGQGCQRTELHKTLVVEYPCQSAYTFGLKPDDKQLEKYFLKKAKHYNILLVYPNPTNDQIRIDIPDNDIYSFEIYNTLSPPRTASPSPSPPHPAAAERPATRTPTERHKPGPPSPPG